MKAEQEIDEILLWQAEKYAPGRSMLAKPPQSALQLTGLNIWWAGAARCSAADWAPCWLRRRLKRVLRNRSANALARVPTSIKLELAINLKAAGQRRLGYTASAPSYRTTVNESDHPTCLNRICGPQFSVNQSFATNAAPHQRDVRPSGLVTGSGRPPACAFGSPVKTKQFSFVRLVSW
jgi:hypothetical protein